MATSTFNILVSLSVLWRPMSFYLVWLCWRFVIVVDIGSKHFCWSPGEKKNEEEIIDSLENCYDPTDTFPPLLVDVHHRLVLPL